VKIASLSLRFDNPTMTVQENRRAKHGKPMSALPPKADIAERDYDFRFVPISGNRPSYSITSSAIDITPAGIVRPSALAVVRLMTSSNLFDCSTGSSAGFAPLSILPV
jgi:hypothetical protein